MLFPSPARRAPLSAPGDPRGPRRHLGPGPSHAAAHPRAADAPARLPAGRAGRAASSTHGEGRDVDHRGAGRGARPAGGRRGLPRPRGHLAARGGARLLPALVDRATRRPSSRDGSRRDAPSLPARPLAPRAPPGNRLRERRPSPAPSPVQAGALGARRRGLPRRRPPRGGFPGSPGARGLPRPRGQLARLLRPRARGGRPPARPRRRRLELPRMLGRAQPPAPAVPLRGHRRPRLGRGAAPGRGPRSRRGAGRLLPGRQPAREVARGARGGPSGRGPGRRRRLGSVRPGALRLGPRRAGVLALGVPGEVPPAPPEKGVAEGRGASRTHRRGCGPASHHLLRVRRPGHGAAARIRERGGLLDALQRRPVRVRGEAAAPARSPPTTTPWSPPCRCPSRRPPGTLPWPWR